jgi:hypothetical protein
VSFEYRVIWKRQGMHRKSKRFATLKAAERRVRLLGPEPWTAFDRDPDEPWCSCRGSHECPCGGETLREKLLRERTEGPDPDGGGMPAIQEIRIERRVIAPWEAVQ